MAALSPLTQSLASRLFSISALLPLSRSLLLSRAKTIHTTLASRETRAEQEFRALPYPQTQPDHSVFEDISDDYADASLTGENAVTTRQGDWASSRALEALVSGGRGKYEEARAVLAELQDMHVPIRPRRMYAYAALNGVRRALASERDETVAASDRDPFFVFDLWFEHLADANVLMLSYWRTSPPGLREAPWNYKIAPLRNLFEHIVRDSQTPPKLLEHILLAATRKGYYAFLARLVTTRLAHLYDAEQMARFLDQLSSVATAHAFKIKDHEQVDYVEAYSAVLWANAILKQCNDHHISDALALLRAAVARNIRLSKFTFRYVVGVVRDNPGAVEEVVALSGKPNLQGAKLREVLGDTNNEDLPKINVRRSLEENLDIATHHLRMRSVAPGSGIGVARAILPLFQLAYGAPKTQRRHILQALHSRAYSLGTLQDVLHAHMLFNLRRRKPANVLAVYRRYFHPASVPYDLMRMQLRDSLANRRVNQLITLPDKLEPGRQIQALAWGALAHLTRDAALFEELYSRLLAAADHVRMRDYVSPEAFHHFIRPTGRRLPEHVRTHEFAQRVLADMDRRGIEQTVRVHGAAAGAYLSDGVMDGFTSHVDTMFEKCRAQLDKTDRWIVRRRLREARQGGVAELLGVALHTKAYDEARALIQRLEEQEEFEDTLGWKRLDPPPVLLDRMRDLLAAEARQKRRRGIVDSVEDLAKMNAEAPGGAWLGNGDSFPVSEPVSEQTPVVQEPEGAEEFDEDEEHERRGGRVRTLAHEHGGGRW
ncbi:hypothetical protein PENSPDRAFT_760194 [Peniophora sp. CONT]|nr:hypothetical protein PENSPDRAFT_760194 [Peniophora sp. CONT]